MLLLNLHFHTIVPEGVFTEAEDGRAIFHDLPAPEDEDVLAILRKVIKKVRALLERRGAFDDDPPSTLSRMHAEATQAGLPFDDADPPRPKRRTASIDGYSLHAGTFVHENDRQGLERLCRYGLRPPIALERLSLLPSGKVAYQVKRPAPGRPATLVMDPLDLLKKIAALIPPPRAHLVKYAGVFASAARLRKKLRPAPPAQSPPPVQQPRDPMALLLPWVKDTLRQRRLDWAALIKRVYAKDVLECGKCKGRMRLMAFVTDRDTARAILEHLGLPTTGPPQAPARGPPQLAQEWDQSGPELSALH